MGVFGTVRLNFDAPITGSIVESDLDNFTLRENDDTPYGTPYLVEIDPPSIVFNVQSEAGVLPYPPAGTCNVPAIPSVIIPGYSAFEGVTDFPWAAD